MHDEAKYEEMFGMDDGDIEQLQKVLEGVFMEFKTLPERIHIVRGVENPIVREAAMFTLGIVEGTLRGFDRASGKEKKK
jgi:hypothetical protein